MSKQHHYKTHGRLSKDTIIKLVQDNPDLFVHNNIIPEEQIASWRGIQKPNLTGDFNIDRNNIKLYESRKTGMYSKINTYMRTQGLYLKQVNNGAGYKVLIPEEVDKEVQRYEHAVPTNRRCAIKLASGNQSARITKRWEQKKY